MKVYNNYMDNISVSNELHVKILSRAAPPRRAAAPARRYAAVFACLAVILLCSLTLPRLLQKSGDSPISATYTPKQPYTSQSPSTDAPTQPNSSPAPSTSPPREYELIFNTSENKISASIIIPGHFWRKASPAELEKVFPGLTDVYTIEASVSYTSDQSGAELFDITANVSPAAGFRTYVRLSPDAAVQDYVFDVDIIFSDILGTSVAASIYETPPNSQGSQNVIYFASFVLSGTHYYVELGGSKTQDAELRAEFTELVGRLIESGGADLSIFDNPEIPELRDDIFTLDEAYADADLGAYLPSSVPSGFAFEEARRFINQEVNHLEVCWTKGLANLTWRVSSKLNDWHTSRITSVADTKNYDLARYPIPRFDSVPEDLRQIVDCPIFRIEELALEAVRMRAYSVSDAGDVSGPRMEFGVLYGDILVEVNVKGITPEKLFEMLCEI